MNGKKYIKIKIFSRFIFLIIFRMFINQIQMKSNEGSIHKLNFDSDIIDLMMVRI